jgi:ubiquitin C-terminal hydrolase
LDQSLESFFYQEKLTDSNKYFCETCGSKVTARKGYFMSKSPKTLFLHLKRFNYMHQKLTHKIEFPLELKKPLDPFTLDKSGYSLFGIIEHKGRGVKSGHYFSYVKNPVTNLWYLCDDHKIREVPEKTALSSQAFILAYTLTSKLADDDLKSNISVSSFGTVINPIKSM